MPRTLPEINITVASMPCLSKILASLATHSTEEEPGVVEMYEVFSLSAAGELCAVRNSASDGGENGNGSLASSMTSAQNISTWRTYALTYTRHQQCAKSSSSNRWRWQFASGHAKSRLGNLLPRRTAALTWRGFQFQSTSMKRRVDLDHVRPRRNTCGHGR